MSFRSIVISATGSVKGKGKLLVPIASRSITSFPPPVIPGHGYRNSSGFDEAVNPVHSTLVPFVIEQTVCHWIRVVLIYIRREERGAMISIRGC
jgi:hypothetical protein